MSLMNLPNFLVIGAPRSGTTSLYQWLSLHPNVFMPEIKEPHYFTYANMVNVFFEDKKVPLPNYSKNWNDYIKLFEKADSNIHLAIGEASPTYLASPGAPLLIKQKLPNVRLIAIIRNPIERAFSYYLLGVRDGWAPSSFREALAWEDYMVTKYDIAEVHHYHWFKMGGRYADQLEKYFELFQSQLRVYLFEDLINKQSDILSDICDFLNIRKDLISMKLPREASSNQPRFGRMQHKVIRLFYKNPILWKGFQSMPLGFKKRIRKVLQRESLSKNKIATDIAMELLEYYKPQIERLERILGRDLSSWYNVESYA